MYSEQKQGSNPFPILDFTPLLCYNLNREIGKSFTEAFFSCRLREQIMVFWIFILVFLSILAYLTQVGILFLMQIHFPFMTASLINVLVLICMACVLVRILGRMKKGEKEALSRRIEELEKELRENKEKKKSNVESEERQG